MKTCILHCTKIMNFIYGFSFEEMAQIIFLTLETVETFKNE